MENKYIMENKYEKLNNGINKILFIYPLLYFILQKSPEDFFIKISTIISITTVYYLYFYKYVPNNLYNTIILQILYVIINKDIFTNFFSLAQNITDIKKTDTNHLLKLIGIIVISSFASYNVPEKYKSLIFISVFLSLKFAIGDNIHESFVFFILSLIYDNLLKNNQKIIKNI